MNSKFEVVEIDAEEAAKVVGGMLIPNFLDALQRNAEPVLNYSWLTDQVGRAAK